MSDGVRLWILDFDKDAALGHIMESECNLPMNRFLQVFRFAVLQINGSSCHVDVAEQRIQFSYSVGGDLKHASSPLERSQDSPYTMMREMVESYQGVTRKEDSKPKLKAIMNDAEKRVEEKKVELQKRKVLS